MFIFAEYYRKTNLNDYSMIDYNHFKKKLNNDPLNWFDIYPFYSDVIIENLNDYRQESSALNGFDIEKSIIVKNKKVRTRRRFSNKFISDVILLQPLNPPTDLKIVIKNRNPFSQLSDSVTSSTHFSFQKEHEVDMGRDGDICLLFSSSKFEIKSKENVDMIVNYITIL